MTEKQKQYEENAGWQSDHSTDNDYVIFHESTYVGRQIDIDKIKSFDDYLRVLKATGTIHVYATEDQLEEIKELLK